MHRDGDPVKSTFPQPLAARAVAVPFPGRNCPNRRGDGFASASTRRSFASNDSWIKAPGAKGISRCETIRWNLSKTPSATMGRKDEIGKKSASQNSCPELPGINFTGFHCHRQEIKQNRRWPTRLFVTVVFGIFVPRQGNEHFRS